MMRFYDIQHGQVLIDGLDVREHDLRRLRRHFGVVLQDPFLFTRHNWGQYPARHHRITDARMRDKPPMRLTLMTSSARCRGGSRSRVSERGSSSPPVRSSLSTSPARWPTHPRILILDEATSSVDTDTEIRVRMALERMIKGRTSVVIAHRLSTVQRADTILVMHKGHLREMGSHQELLAHRGIYWKLYQLQYKDQELGDRGWD